jgi:hypothetical protein
VYLIVRGDEMTEHAMEQSSMRDQMYLSYTSPRPAPPSTKVEDLATLVTLRDQGVIDDTEFLRLKSKVTV